LSHVPGYEHCVAED